MVGWARAPQGAPVFRMAGKVTLIQSTFLGIDLSGGGFKNHILETATMVMTPIQTHPLLAAIFNAATDFTVFADHCAETLIESKGIALKKVLCGRLNAALAMLRPNC